MRQRPLRVHLAKQGHVTHALVRHLKFAKSLPTCAVLFILNTDQHDQASLSFPDSIAKILDQTSIYVLQGLMERPTTRQL